MKVYQSEATDPVTPGLILFPLRTRAACSKSLSLPFVHEPINVGRTCIQCKCIFSRARR